MVSVIILNRLNTFIISIQTSPLERDITGVDKILTKMTEL